MMPEWREANSASAAAPPRRRSPRSLVIHFGSGRRNAAKLFNVVHSGRNDTTAGTKTSKTRHQRRKFRGRLIMIKPVVGIALATLALAGSSSAADPPRVVYKAPPPVPLFSWTGF